MSSLHGPSHVPMWAQGLLSLQVLSVRSTQLCPRGSPRDVVWRKGTVAALRLVTHQLGEKAALSSCFLTGVHLSHPDLSAPLPG